MFHPSNNMKLRIEINKKEKIRFKYLQFFMVKHMHVAVSKINKSINVAGKNPSINSYNPPSLINL